MGTASLLKWTKKSSRRDVLTQRENGDVWWSVWAQQCVLPGFVEWHLLIKHSFNWTHHRFKAMHPKCESLVWLVVSLLLLKKQTPKSLRTTERSCQATYADYYKHCSIKPGLGTLVSHLQCWAAPHNQLNWMERETLHFLRISQYSKKQAWDNY